MNRHCLTERDKAAEPCERLGFAFAFRTKTSELTGSGFFYPLLLLHLPQRFPAGVEIVVDVNAHCVGVPLSIIRAAETFNKASRAPCSRRPVNGNFNSVGIDAGYNYRSKLRERP